MMMMLVVLTITFWTELNWRGKKVKIQLLYCTAYAASLALCITDRASVQPRLQPKSADTSDVVLETKVLVSRHLEDKK